MLPRLPSSMHAGATTPAGAVWCMCRFSSQTAIGLPLTQGGSAPALPVSRPARRSLHAPACMVAELLNAALLSGVLQSMSLPPRTAPAATSRKDSCWVGFAPTRKTRLSTAHLDNPAAPEAGVAGFDDFIETFAGGIDGLWGETAKQISVVVNPETFRLALRTFRDGSGGNANRGEISFADYAMANFGGFWTNKRMPAKAAHVSQAILHRMGRTMEGGAASMRTATCPHWGEVSVDDIYSGAASGVRSFTMHSLIGDVILVQPDAYSQVAIRVSV